MHGVKRTRISVEAAEAKRLKELSKIQEYLALQDDILARKRANEYTFEALQKSQRVLDINPEFYTVWNYRRNILTRGIFPQLEPPEIVSLLTNDLRLTSAYLKVHPKVYWIWTHRKWCLSQVPLGPDGTEGWRNECWKVEMMTVEKYLNADARNYHAWAYRRFIIASLPPSYTPRQSAADELKYTTKKIESNFSNFSAWHYRSNILTKMWEGIDYDTIEKAKAKEFELVTQALWTDPGDQSGWLYHKWLVGSHPSPIVLRRELASFKELHEAEPDSKWCLNALAQYLLLLSNHELTQHDEQVELQAEAKSMLQRLEAIDGDRKARYDELENLY